MRLLRFIKANWPYMIMLVFVIFITFILILAERLGKPIKEDVVESCKIELIDTGKIKERQEDIEKLYYKNPPLYLLLVALNVSILFIFFSGIAIDYFLFYRQRINKPFFINTLRQKIIRWGVGDVVRFSIMFYAFAYTFMLVETALSDKFPILNNKNFRFIFNTTVVDAAGILFVLNFVVFIHGQNISAIGATLKNCFRNIYYGIVGYIAVIPALFITMIITAIIITVLKYKPPIQPIVDIILREQKIPILIYSSLFAAIAGPIMEEVVFRGFMYNAIKKHLGAFWGILITALIFSILHAHWVGFMPILILGILLAYLYEKTGSLVSSITVHITHNLASLLLVFLMKAFGL